MTRCEQLATPLDIEALRTKAVSDGALDPATLLFWIIEYNKASGQLLGVLARDLDFWTAVEEAERLVQARESSHFCLQPIGFVQ